MKIHNIFRVLHMALSIAFVGFLEGPILENHRFSLRKNKDFQGFAFLVQTLLHVIFVADFVFASRLQGAVSTASLFNL